MTTPHDKALKPCPFCGSENLSIRHSDIEGWIAHVACANCDDMLGPMSKFKYDDKEDASTDAIEVRNRRAPLPIAGKGDELEEPWWQDKIEGLEADLDSAVEVAYRRGATEWVRLNYPTHYARLSSTPPSQLSEDTEGGA